ncbi:MAG TPA: hypothetical protein DCM55_05175 [Corynebacterium variabile]|nr:hypothetical protein [Corynebacterium variabile]
MSPKKKAVIHNRVRVLRAERDMSRAQLAELIGVNPQTVGALERGDHSPSLDLAFRICEIFSLPVEAVFSRTPFGPFLIFVPLVILRSIAGGMNRDLLISGEAEEIEDADALNTTASTTTREDPS